MPHLQTNPLEKDLFIIDPQDYLKNMNDMSSEQVIKIKFIIVN